MIVHTSLIRIGFQTVTQHPSLATGRVAVITGAASGIGLAAAERFASLGMHVCMADIAEGALRDAAALVSGRAANGPGDVMHQITDVSNAAALNDL